MGTLSEALKKKRDAEARRQRNEQITVFIDGGSGIPEPTIQQVVKRLNGLSGDISIVAGSNIQISSSEGNIEISAVDEGRIVLPDYMESDPEYGIKIYTEIEKQNLIATLGKINAPAGSVEAVRVPYDEDGTRVWYRAVSGSTIQAVFSGGTGPAAELSEASIVNLNRLQTVEGRSLYEHPQVFWFNFSQPKDLVKFCILYSCANNRWGDMTALVLQVSNDSTDGADGTWHTGTYSGIPSYGDNEVEATRDISFPIADATWLRIGSTGKAYQASPLIYSIFLWENSIKNYLYGLFAPNVIPPEGLGGQVLSKTSDSDYDCEWSNVETNIVDGVEFDLEGIQDGYILYYDAASGKIKAKTP